MVCDDSTVRIAFVIPYFYPALGYGGTPRLAYDAAQALRRRGHDVTVLTTDAGGEDRVSNEVIKGFQANGTNGLHVYFYKNLSNSLAYRHRIFVPPHFFADVRRRLSESEIVHIHDLRSFLSVASHRAARALGIPYVLSPHAGLPHLGKKSAKVIFDFLWGKSILRNSAAVCAVSPLEQRDATMFGIEQKRIYSLPPALDADLYRHLPERGSFSSRWNSQERKIVLFLGRLHWIKGADILIDAFSMMTNQSNTHLVIGGPDDGAEQQLRSLVAARGLQDKVTFTGFLDDKQKLAALVDSNAVVISSRREGFPLTLLESLAATTPVILTSACDIGDWIAGQPGVAVFRSEDPQDLARKLQAALDSPPDRRLMIQTRDFVLSEFSADALAAKAEALYESLLRTRV
jgi:glycosyltransferase involved in cell wall biosynthesis